MTETKIPWVASATYFKVLCRLGINRPDGVGDEDGNPDLMTLGGTVDIRAAVSRFRYTEADGRSRMVTMPSGTYQIQASTGELFDADGNIGVLLINSASPGVDPSGFTYSATVRPNIGEPWDVTFPGNQPTATVDLVSAATVASSNGVGSLEGRVTVLEQEVEELQASPGGSEGGVTDHGELTGRNDDDHPQYHTDARGDARYVPLTRTVAGKALSSNITLTPADVGAATAAQGVKADSASQPGHTQASITITDLTEAVQDIVGALIVAGTNTTVTYNDAAGTFTINASTGGSTDPEVVRDTIGGALVAGAGIQITVNDAGDTITVTSTAVLPTRQIIAGTGLTGGGDLAADRTLAVDFAASGASSATKAVRSDDSRLTLDGLGGAPASGQATVNALTAAASVTVPATHSMHTLTMTTNTTLVFANPTAGHAFTLKLSGAFTPTFPASVTWAGGSAPAYASGKVYVFASFDAGTSWTGSAL